MPLAAMAAITIGTQIAAAVVKHKAANAAKKAQQQGADKAMEYQTTQRDEAQKRLEPFARGEHSMAALLGGAQKPGSMPAPYVGPGAGGVGGQPISNVKQYNDAGMAQAPPWMMPRNQAAMPPPPGPPPQTPTFPTPPPPGAVPVGPPGSAVPRVPGPPGAQPNPPPGMNYRYQPNGPPPAYGQAPSPGMPPPPQPIQTNWQPQYLGEVMT